MVTIVVKTEAQEIKTNSFFGKWRLNWVESGFFPKKDLLFESTSQKLTEYIFEFKKDGTVIHKNDPNTECPVGVFTLKDGNWKYVNGILTLELRGAKLAEYWYWWIINYKVEKKDDKMWLKVDKIIKNRQLPVSATWKELIKG